jgi:hypothetical protein
MPQPLLGDEVVLESRAAANRLHQEESARYPGA